MLDRSTELSCEYLLPGVANFKRALLASDIRCLDIDAYSGASSKYERKVFTVPPSSSCLGTTTSSANGKEKECLKVDTAADEPDSSDKRGVETAEASRVSTLDTYRQYDKTALLAVLRNAKGLKTRATVKALLQPDPQSRKVVCEAKKCANQERLANDSARARFRRQYLCVVEELTQKQFLLKRLDGDLSTDSVALEGLPSKSTPAPKEGASFPYVRDLRALKLPEIKQKKRAILSVGPPHQAKSSRTSFLAEKTKQHSPHIDASLSWRSQKVVLEERPKPMRATRAYSEKWKCVTCTRSRNAVEAHTSGQTTVVSKTLSSSL
ncbi:conserved hypothetical protein [Neospora caninum Liverpool]|uniref:Uncharacterized protein n=1 Tax=Neospora caninum (strain Liverpool) TaxID=572307 RepID=F0VEY3_NEOCL|nr:conserved hypothetical protein [Neospora caninum Liverpool]CBZ52277.1 conserved hypothetical protein [Neospora caninum Liverpool]CEL66245.1 TPA: hypothetical protein BN1204_020640 [Neospora caninum Liverpool]|eukprot:XP_003882309.1 conserved hypothetical protein [Neospora caninum Liverpool]